MMGFIRRSWTPAEAEGWSKEDTIAVIISPLIYMLLLVGVALAANDTSAVEAWLKSGDLVKIEAIHAAQWETDGPAFEALVVSPFVLCRPVR